MTKRQVKTERASVGKRQESPQGVEGQALGIGTCNNCGGEKRCRRRTISEKAWTVLLLWNEVDPRTVDQPICDDCYKDLRDILIERNDEIDKALLERSDEVDRIRSTLGSVAS